ncbi:MAG: hypothetical protein U0637_11575 [Phycisphaerales bacterium]
MKRGLAVAAVLVAASNALAQMSTGADVIYSDITGVQTYGPVNGKYAYAYSSNTCNIGNQNAEWNISGVNGSPGLAMNLFRLKDGRLMQIGQSFVKHACCAAAGSGCVTIGGQTVSCNGTGGTQLGSGCQDVYSAGYNGGQSGLGARSKINAWSGIFQARNTGSGDAIFKRLQVAQTDLAAASNVNAQYFAEGIYVSTRDAAAGNRNNNASYKRVTVVNNGATLTPTGTVGRGVPAIQAWHDHGLGANLPDNSVVVAAVDVPADPALPGDTGEGRYWVAYKARDNGNGTWRYEYAIYNLSSDLAGGSFTVPVPANVNVTGLGFNAPLNHSGEVYNNNPWSTVRNANSVAFACTTAYSAANDTGNALRWGTMFNFWFDADTAPAAATASASMGLYKSATGLTLNFPVSVPAEAQCDSIDTNGDAASPDTADIDYFLSIFAGGPCLPAPATCDVDFNNDGLFPDSTDITAMLSVFAGGGCVR